MSFEHNSNAKFLEDNAGIVNVEGRGKGVKAPVFKANELPKNNG